MTNGFFRVPEKTSLVSCFSEFCGERRRGISSGEKLLSLDWRNRHRID